MKTYKDELIKSMNYLAEKPNTIFVGQQTAYAGNPMSTTILDVSKDKMIETPVFEEVQMGMSTGLGMTNMCVITFYPRWDFLICAANQLINHLDKFKHMTGYDSHVIIRVGKGSDDPIYTRNVNTVEFFLLNSSFMIGVYPSLIMLEQVVSYQAPETCK